MTVLPESVSAVTELVSRALACATALNFLALTTPVVDLIDLGRRLHIPELLIDMMTLIYRFVFALLDSLEQMRLAQESRLGYANSRTAMRSAALIASNLFMDTFRRSQRLQVALEGRCYEGTLRVLPSLRLRPWTFYTASVFVVASLLSAWRLFS
jgi:cobalt/nickel transport system permease protein